MKTALRMLILLAVAGALGTAANALSPRGLSWSRPLGRGVAQEVADAGFVPVDLKTAQELVRKKSVRIVDARRKEEYRIGRLPGAVNHPAFHDQIPSLLHIKNEPVLVYCSNEFCDDALWTAAAYRRMGYTDIAVFVDGYEAWWNAKGPVDED